MARPSRFFDQGWEITTSGDGVADTSVSDAAAITCTASADSRAFALHYIVAWPGDEFEFTVNGLNLPDAGKSGWGIMFADINGTRRDERRFNGAGFSEKTIRVVVPTLLSGPRTISFGIGVDLPRDGSATFVNPIINKTKGDDTWLYATFKVDGSTGVMTVHDSHLPFNVRSSDISWDAANFRYNVVPRQTTNSLFNNGTTKYKPQITMAGDPTNSQTIKATWTAGAILDNGAFSIQALDGATGARLDLGSGLGSDLFVSVKMEL